MITSMIAVATVAAHQRDPCRAGSAPAGAAPKPNGSFMLPLTRADRMVYAAWLNVAPGDRIPASCCTPTQPGNVRCAAAVIRCSMIRSISIGTSADWAIQKAQPCTFFWMNAKIRSPRSRKPSTG
eukprot:5492458-Prymnesium_polylepis.1